MPTAPGERPLHRLDPRRALPRAVLSVLVAVGAAVLVDVRTSSPLAAIAGWDLGGATLVALAWSSIASADAATTRARAAADDPGRGVIYALVVLASAASLLAAVVLARRPRVVPAAEGAALVALCLATVVLSWVLTQTAFALRYAHLYYREDDEGVGGVELPGGRPPTYLDFAYVAFTIGMCFQVSDATVTSAQVRRTVLLHALLSFAYNTAVLAFVLNLVFAAA